MKCTLQFHVYIRGSKVDDKQNAVSRTFRPSPRQPYCNVRGNNIDNTSTFMYIKCDNCYD